MNKANVRHAVNQIKLWLEWLKKDVEKSNYRDLMNYIGYLQSKEKNPNQINRILQGISHYYTFRGLKNVAIGTRIKGVVQKARLSVFTEAQLDEKYQSFTVKERKGYYYLSDKMVLGLMI